MDEGKEKKSTESTPPAESGSELTKVLNQPKVRILRRVSIQFDGNGNKPTYQVNCQLTSGEVFVGTAKPMDEVSFTSFWGVLGQEIDNALNSR